MSKPSPSTKWFAFLFIILLPIAAFIFLPKRDEPANLPDYVDFNYHIRPILSQNCFVCHGPDESTREAGLRLDAFEHATAVLESGRAAVISGNSGESLLVERISADDPEDRMPPPKAKKTLTAEEIALIKRWIDQGAEWKKHWAFIPPQLPKFPEELQEAPTAEIIDYLIDQKLQNKKLTPSSEAEKNVLVRRASYLLTGLPPRMDDLSKFGADSTDQAWEKVVEHYLASPHFGERWARHWMDLMRYGETMGHEFDYEITEAWRYRDYLIRAFNADVPYDLFVKEHLAGDQLKEPRFHPTEDFNESVFGTAYFFLGEGKHSPVSTRQEEADRIDNVIDVTSKTFQALTVSCARCHDHKFDPIPTRDYYAMYGMIESSRITPLPARKSKKQHAIVLELKKLKQEIRAHFARDFPEASAAASEAPPLAPSHDFVILGDFRNGDWGDWHADGWAFGETPLKGEPVFNVDSAKVEEIINGVASSRYFKKGVHGALRSPNFVIEHDSIFVRAAGKNGTIRIIVDNFQLIQDPLYGSLQQVVKDSTLKTYTFDLSLVQNRKAYLEFLPGRYDKHVYHLTPEDYIEVEFAAAFNDSLPDFSASSEIEKAISQDNQRSMSEKLRALVFQCDSLASQLYDSTRFMGLTEGEAILSPVFVRGSIAQESDERVPRQFLSAVDAVDFDFPQHGDGRLAWAEAVVDPRNPLTARVVVNRLWRHVFGRGIVSTPDNFGLQGKLPSHPELLDFLALRFVEDGWSIKKMLKNILLTSTFRRSATAVETNRKLDPQNTFLHHFPVRRLEAEAIRDGVLAVSGRLDSTMFGKPVPIHLTDFMKGRGRPAASGPLDGDGRRSIYIAVRRNFLSPMMLTFNAPSPMTTFGSRNTTNVPAQSLMLMNDPFVHQQAEYWANRLLTSGENTSIKKLVEEIYLTAFSRKPTEPELSKAKTFLLKQAKNYDITDNELMQSTQLWADFCHTILNLKEFIHLL